MEEEFAKKVIESVVMVIVSIIIVVVLRLSIKAIWGREDNSNSLVEETPCVEPIIIHDTIIDSKCVEQLDSLIYVHELTKDSLKYMKDSLGEDLFVARYKLGRIKYYTDIAAKGNNIKFYRGWVLRTLND